MKVLHTDPSKSRKCVQNVSQDVCTSSSDDRLYIGISKSTPETFSPKLDTTYPHGPWHPLGYCYFGFCQINDLNVGNHNLNRQG